MKPVSLLIMAVVLATLGQILMKKGVLLVGQVNLGQALTKGLFHLLFNPLVLMGLACYAISSVLWLSALSRTTLSFVYPFTALTFVLVMLSARLVFLETVPALRYVGAGVICLGFLISSLA